MTLTPSANTSAAIIAIRPLLILFIMLAHLTLLDIASVMAAAQPLDFDSWLSVFLKAALAKSGVPLLSLISGYLAVVSLQNYGYFRLLGRKAQRLLWPLVWANLLYILLITWPGQAANPAVRPDLSIHPFDAYGWFQAVFAFYKLPANLPLFFLKDLFTCFLLLPLLVAVAKIRFLNLLVIPWMAWKCIYLDSVFLVPVYPLWFMRFDIVFAFYLGILLVLNGRSLVIGNRSVNMALTLLVPLACGVAAAVYVTHSRPDNQTLFLWLDFAVKVLSVIGCIGLMGLLGPSQNVLARSLKRLSPYSFSMFLTHAISIHFFNRAWLQLFGRPDFWGWSGIAYMVLVFVAATAAAVALRIAWRGAVTRFRAPA